MSEELKVREIVITVTISHSLGLVNVTFDSQHMTRYETRLLILSLCEKRKRDEFMASKKGLRNLFFPFPLGSRFLFYSSSSSSSLRVVCVTLDLKERQEPLLVI